MTDLQNDYLLTWLKMNSKLLLGIDGLLLFNYLVLPIFRTNIKEMNFG
jgi:hypothetical protein